MSKAELIGDFDTIQKALEHALTYPKKQNLGEEGYQKAHEELSMALYSLKRLERTVMKSDIGVEMFIPQYKTGH